MRMIKSSYKEIADWNQYEKLKYATLLSANLKSLSDINLTGSKIIDSFILSSHRYLSETYCSINEIVNVYESWSRKVLTLILNLAFKERTDAIYTQILSKNVDELRMAFLIEDLEEIKYLKLISKVHNLTVDYLKNRIKLSLLPKENGDFEIAIMQFRKVIINTIRFFGTLVNSLDRIYQYYKLNYGKPIMFLNSSLLGNDKLAYLIKFLKIVYDNIPNVKLIFIYIDEEILGKENLISCQIDLIIKELQKEFKDLEFRNLQI